MTGIKEKKPLDELTQLKDELDPLFDDDLINSFRTNFKDLLKEHTFDLIVTHKGKGTNFLKYLVKDVEYKSDLFIQESDIKNKRILWFDDAIRTGNTFKKTLAEMLIFKPAHLTIACLMITNTCLEKIKIQDKQYNFRLLGMVVPDKCYNLFYRRIFFPLIGKMDYYLEEYPEFILNIKLSSGLKFEEISDIINSKLISDSDDIFEVPFLLNHSNIKKCSISFNKYPLNIESPIKCEIFLSKIRIWIYFNDIDEIRMNIKPIVHLILEEDLKKCNKTHDFCFKKSNIKTKHICQNCVTYLHCRELGKYFHNKLCQELDKLNLEWEIKENIPYK